MLTSRALLVPVLPTLLMDEHRGHQTAMITALAEQSDALRAEAPDAIVVVSAHWETQGPFCVAAGKHHTTLTEYSGFGVEVRYDCPGHPALARALVDAGTKSGVRVAAANRGVDSGVTIPLHFLWRSPTIPVVPLSVADQTAERCRAWGAVIRRTLAARPERVAFIVGGMLSFNGHAWSLGREVPEARAFDERAIEALGRGDWAGLRALEKHEAEKAQPHVGLRHLEVLRGFLLEDVPGTARCYESNPGVGGALIEFAIEAPVVAESPAPESPH
jgi:aromatic ring-opening dioxygenase catalytic subunit (LigB family)